MLFGEPQFSSIIPDNRMSVLKSGPPTSGMVLPANIKHLVQFWSYDLGKMSGVYSS